MGASELGVGAGGGGGHVCFMRLCGLALLFTSVRGS